MARKKKKGEGLKIGEIEKKKERSKERNRSCRSWAQREGLSM
jgi:hypothetical protein